MYGTTVHLVGVPTTHASGRSRSASDRPESHRSPRLARHPREGIDTETIADQVVHVAAGMTVWQRHRTPSDRFGRASDDCELTGLRRENDGVSVGDAEANGVFRVDQELGWIELA